MVLYIGIYIESDWLYHAEWVALSNGQSGSELAEYSYEKGTRHFGFLRINAATLLCMLRVIYIPY